MAEDRDVKQPISAVLFDLDGTLLDTAPDFYRAISRMRKELELPQLPYELIRNSVSDGAAALIEVCFSLSREEEQFAELNQRLLDYYLEDIGSDSTLFDHLDELLNWLESRSIPWGIVTNKPERFTTPLLRQLTLSSRSSTIICPDQVTNRKPDPEALLLACNEIGHKSATTVYVGDHQRDIEAGRRAGMRTVAASYGYLKHNDAPEKWHADFIADSGEELLRWLQQQI
ncbi:MAG: phosphoglycolate phosphatase [Motiliproteus sp.]|nr:phosphoglycolate phosphatase [Motiliproteus sp.]MCW9053474.1 phosphoglycolate phosphatase [Motiliproteus sp.]